MWSASSPGDEGSVSARRALRTSQKDRPVLATPDRRPTTPDMLQTGMPAPDFTVQDESGTLRSLANFRGKTVVLWFYPKADTPG